MILYVMFISFLSACIRSEICYVGRVMHVPGGQSPAPQRRVPGFDFTPFHAEFITDKLALRKDISTSTSVSSSKYRSTMDKTQYLQLTASLNNPLKMSFFTRG